MIISTSAERSKLPHLLLVAHLSQAFFPLVRRHLVAFSFFAAGHATSFCPVIDVIAELCAVE
jgi:hypothetical protein